MAFPEPVPQLNGKEVDEFESRIGKFKLSPAQKRFYKEGMDRFGEKKK